MKHMILHMMVPFSCTNCDFEGRNEQTILQESIWYLVLVCYVYMLIYVSKIVTVFKNTLFTRFIVGREYLSLNRYTIGQFDYVFVMR